MELTAAGIPFQAEVPFRIVFRDRVLQTAYRADFVCYAKVLVELKALGALSGVETAQVLNYLKASHLERALLLNFGTPRLECRRLVMTHPPTAGRPIVLDTPCIRPHFARPNIVRLTRVLRELAGD